MIYRIFFAIVTAVFIISAVLISGPVEAGETAGNGPKLASSTHNFEGMLAIKEGHGDILVRSENGKQKRLKVKKNTIITRNGKSATFDDLRARDQLRHLRDVFLNEPLPRPCAGGGVEYISGWVVDDDGRHD